MRSLIARALSLGLIALALAPSACRDDKPAPTPTGTGGATGRGGTGGRTNPAGTGGTKVDAAAPDMVAPVDMAAPEDGLVPVAEAGETAETGEQPDVIVAETGDVVTPIDTVVPEVSGDAPPAVAMRPFYSKPPYPAGTIMPTGAQVMIDAAVTAFYDKWKTDYVKTACSGAFVQAPTELNVGTGTVSDIHGAGMIATVIMAGHDNNAKPTFDGMFKVARLYKSGGDPALMAAEVKRTGTGPCSAPAASDARTAGNLHIALALLMADKQWGSAGEINYLDEAKKTIAAIRARLMNPVTKLPMTADYDANDPANAVRVSSSNLSPVHFQAFQNATADAFWGEAITNSYALIAKIQAGPSVNTGLLPDVIVNTASATPTPATDGTNGIYFYDAAHVPLHLVMDYLSNSARAPGAKPVLEKITTWIKTKTTGMPAMVIDGYQLNGNNRSGGSDVGESPLFETPFGAAAIVDVAHQAWFDAIWARAVKDTITGNASIETIQVLALVVMSGHWWAP